MSESERTSACPCTCDVAVYFSTGFRYEEGPIHLTEFGGYEDSMFDIVSWVWKKEDQEHVWDRLVRSSTWLDVQVFPATLEGTDALYAALKEQGFPTRFAFGLLVWHQLGYVSRLEGNYEGGQCGSLACWHRK